jgi:HAD superfamily hydrolase (TIGR01484 family)
MPKNEKKHHAFLDWQAEQLKQGKQIVFFFDYDGTFAEHQSERMEASPVNSVKAALNLLDRYKIPYFIVTGRPVKELDILINLGTTKKRTVPVIGNHGNELRIGEEKKVFYALNKTEKDFTETALKGAQKLASDFIATHNLAKYGIKLINLVEEKTCGDQKTGFAFHYLALIDEKVDAKIVNQYIKEYKTFLSGLLNQEKNQRIYSRDKNSESNLPVFSYDDASLNSTEFNINPKIVNKGDSIKRVFEARFPSEKYVPVFFGDSFKPGGTDLPAARVVKALGGVSVQVLNPHGDRKPEYLKTAVESTDAQYYVDTPSGVGNLLIEAVKQHHKKQPLFKRAVSHLLMLFKMRPILSGNFFIASAMFCLSRIQNSHQAPSIFRLFTANVSPENNDLTGPSIQ